MITLGLHGCNISDTSSFQYIPNLSTLGLSQSNISDTSFLNYLLNLVTLDLSDNQIKNICIEALKKLTKIRLYQNPIQSISLKNCISIEYLDLSSFKEIQKVELRDLPNLINLNLSENQITNISLENFEKLSIINLSYNPLQCILLKNCSNIEKIDLSGLTLEKVELDGLPSLKHLNLSYNQIVNISFLQNLPNLHHLNLSHNPIADISLLEELPNLKYLYLSHNQIIDIYSLQNLPNLQDLNLSHNQIIDISFWQNLPNLQHLNLSHNQIIDISFLENLTNMENLVSFDLRGNQISYINLENLNNLTTINLIGNPLRNISLKNCASLENLGCSDLKLLRKIKLDGLTNLKYLGLSNTRISHIFLDNLPNLSVLSLALCQITHLDFLAGLSNLVSLDLSKNNISDISFLAGLSNLVSLDLSHTQISDISFLAGLSNLVSLDLSHTQISDISFLADLSNLVSLDLSHTQISDISFLADLSNLVSLNLNDCSEITENSFFNIFTNLTKLTNLCLGGLNISDYSFLINLMNLITLDLNSNNIFDIYFLTKLMNLTNLNLSYNDILDISPLNNMINLTDLDLYNNRISDISPLYNSNSVKLAKLRIGENHITNISFSFLNKFPELHRLNLENNPITHIPTEITDQWNCLQPLFHYLQDLEKGGTKNNEVKIIFIGNGSVGKTQIANRLAEQEDFVFDLQHHSTHAITLLKRNVDCSFLPEQGLQLNLWDFGGQDIYHATHRLFMQTQALFVLVWDFENEYQQKQHFYKGHPYDNQELCYWLEYARCFGKNSPILILQNKIDETKNAIPLPPPTKEAYQKDYPIHAFLEVSAKTGRGFRLLENKIAEVFEKNEGLQQDLLKELPISWVEIRNKVREEQAKGTKEIDFSTFSTWCKAGEIEDSAPTLIDFLHNTGVLYYKPEYFDGRIILNQAWAIEAIYQILDRDSHYFEILENQQGKLCYKDICKIWKKYSDEERELCMDFMLSCELCFETTENKKYDMPLSARSFVVPQLLPENKPDYISAFYETNTIVTEVLQYRFLPTVFIHRFMVKAHHLAKVSDMWQKGVVVRENENSFAIMIADYIVKTITIQYSTHSTVLLKAIVEELQSIEKEGEVKPQKTGREEIEMGEDYLKGLARIHGTVQQFSVVEIRNLIATDKIKEAIYAMRDLLGGNKEAENMLMGFSARYYHNENEHIQGIISREDSTLELAKIRKGLLHIVAEWA